MTSVPEEVLPDGVPDRSPAEGSRPAALTIADHVEGVVAGDRTILAQTITLIESRRQDHLTKAREVLTALMGHTGAAQRVGITGVPGVGKSTLIEQFGTNLTAAGHRLAVLTVDPSSQRTGGAILGDKARMQRLSADPRAFIRPSPAGNALGGVGRVTRETILLCEAAGFDVVLVETVGVGQSETLVADMVDCFVVLMLPGAGDELQGIKKGVLELADVVAVNKADGDNVTRANTAATDYRHALHLVMAASNNWTVPVLTCSGLANEGLDELWAQIRSHRERMEASGERSARRADQQVRWMWSMIDERMRDRLRDDTRSAQRIAELETEVRSGALAATVAVDRVFESL